MTPHFHLSEFTASVMAAKFSLDNTPDAAALHNLQRLAEVMEVVRNELRGHPVSILSGYRGQKLNDLVNGSRNSAHKTGRAADFICPGYGTPLQICQAIVAAGIEFDQLILEPAWVHFSIAENPRCEVLTALPGNRYAPGLCALETTEGRAT